MGSQQEENSGSFLMVGAQIGGSASHGVTGDNHLFSALGTIVHPREQRNP